MPVLKTTTGNWVGLTGGDVGIEPLVGGGHLHVEASGDLNLEGCLGVDPTSPGNHPEVVEAGRGSGRRVGGDGDLGWSHRDRP